MKYLGLLFLTFFSVSTLACPDISGDFVCKAENNEENYFKWTIKTEVSNETTIYSFEDSDVGILNAGPFFANGQIIEIGDVNIDQETLVDTNYRFECSNHLIAMDFSYSMEDQVDGGYVKVINRDILSTWGPNHLVYDAKTFYGLSNGETITTWGKYICNRAGSQTLPQNLFE